MADPIRHTAFEDAQGLAFGAAMCAFGVLILTGAGLVTGQTAGAAVLISYLTGYSFGVVFFVINLPFYALAWVRLGPAFTLKTFLSVALISGFSMVIGDLVSISPSNPAVAAVLFGMVSGTYGIACHLPPPCQPWLCGHRGLRPARAPGLARGLGAVGL